MGNATYYQSLLSNPNVQKALLSIRKAEGSTYNTLFGGKTFSSYIWHPLQQRAIKLPNGLTTSAAGAYQFERRTWDNVARRLGLRDFSPQNQDIAAIALIDGRGALGDVLNGNISSFYEKVKPEWESFAKKPLSSILNYWNGKADNSPNLSNSNVASSGYIPAVFTLNSEQQKLATQAVPAEWKNIIVWILVLLVGFTVYVNYRS